MDSPFVRCRERVKKTRGRRRGSERGLFIERGRKPECAADKELAKRYREREEEEFLIRAKWGGRSGGRRCVWGAVLLGKKIVLSWRKGEESGGAGQSHDLPQGLHL